MNAAPPRAFTPAAFTQQPQREVVVARRDNPDERARFKFTDDVWLLLDLLKPHERNCAGTIKFAALPDWLKPDAKQYVAHLWLAVGADANGLQQLMVCLRDLGRLLPDFQGRPIDLRACHAREFVRRYCEQGLSPISNQRARRTLNRFAAFVRQQHPEAPGNDFKLVFPRARLLNPQHQPLEQAQAAKLATDVLAVVVDACTADVTAYHEARHTYLDPLEDKRAYNRQFARDRARKAKLGLPLQCGRTARLKELLARAIKGQAVLLAICVGRRAAAVCNTRADIRAERMSWTNDAGQPEQGVCLRFQEMKLRQLEEDVACPDAFGELALQAINTTQTLTEELRRNNPQWADYLFLIPGRPRKSAFVLTPNVLNKYLNGNSGSPGLLQRYQIPVEKFSRITSGTHAPRMPGSADCKSTKSLTTSATAAPKWRCAITSSAARKANAGCRN